jgi:hypothetical protein
LYTFKKPNPIIAPKLNLIKPEDKKVNVQNIEFVDPYEDSIETALLRSPKIICESRQTKERFYL